jgi:hypothetical protein
MLTKQATRVGSFGLDLVEVSGDIAPLWHIPLNEFKKL